MHWFIGSVSVSADIDVVDQYQCVLAEIRCRSLILATVDNLFCLINFAPVTSAALHLTASLKMKIILCTLLPSGVFM